MSAEDIPQAVADHDQFERDLLATFGAQTAYHRARARRLIAREVCPTGLCEACVERVDRALDGLAAAGYVLLPPGGEVVEEWGVRPADATRPEHINPFGQGEPGRGVAAGYVRDLPGWRVAHREIRTWPDGSRWFGPWTVVEEGDDR